MREKIVVMVECSDLQELGEPIRFVFGMVYDEAKGLASIGGPRRWCEIIMMRVGRYWVESTGINPWMHQIVMHKTVSQSRFKRIVRMSRSEWVNGIEKLKGVEHVKVVRNMRRVMR